MDITIEKVIYARNALETGMTAILAENGGHGREEVVYFMQEAIASLYGREYKRELVGADAIYRRPLIDDAGLIALARAAFARHGREWSGEAGFGLTYGGEVVTTGFEPEEGGETLAPFEGSVALCESTDVSESLQSRLFQSACRNEYFGLTER